MGISRTQDVEVLLGEGCTNVEEALDIVEKGCFDLDGPETCVGGYLIVPTASSVEFTTGRTDEFGY